jgi:hypothetical protein
MEVVSCPGSHRMRERGSASQAPEIEAVEFDMGVKVASRWLGSFEPGRLEIVGGWVRLRRGASQVASVPVANVTANTAWSLLGRVVHLWAMDGQWYVDFDPAGLSHWRDLIELVPLVGDIEADRSARRGARRFLTMLNEAKRRAANAA